MVITRFSYNGLFIEMPVINASGAAINVRTAQVIGVERASDLSDTDPDGSE